MGGFQKASCFDPRLRCKARVNIAANRGAMDRAAFDVHSSVSLVKREAAAVAKEMLKPELQLPRSSARSSTVREKAAVAVVASEPLRQSQAKPVTENRASTVLSRSSQVVVDPSVSQEEARRKAHASVRELEEIVAARNSGPYKDVEKECALHMSLVIRHLKSQPNQRAAAEALLRETQAMVAAGRVAVLDGAKLPEFRACLDRMVALMDPDPPKPTRAAPPTLVSQHVTAPPAAAPAKANDPPKPSRAPPPATSPRVLAESGSGVSDAVASSNAKVQLVTARKTTAAAELMRAHGIDPNAQGAMSAAPVAPPPAAVLSPRDERRQLKEQKKQQKLEKLAVKKVEEKEDKKTWSKRRKDKVRQASVSLTNEEKAQLAKMKMDLLREEEERKRMQLKKEEDEDERLMRSEEARLEAEEKRSIESAKEKAAIEAAAKQQALKVQQEQEVAARKKQEVLARKQREEEEEEEAAKRRELEAKKKEGEAKRKAEEDRRRLEEEIEREQLLVDAELARIEVENRRREEEEAERELAQRKKLEEEAAVWQNQMELKLKKEREQELNQRLALEEERAREAVAEEARKKQREEEELALRSRQEAEKEAQRIADEAAAAAEAQREREKEEEEERLRREAEEIAERERLAEIERKRVESEEMSVKTEGSDVLNALEKSIREKEERLKQAKAKKKENERQAKLDKMKREKERLQREREEEEAKLKEEQRIAEAVAAQKREQEQQAAIAAAQKLKAEQAAQRAAAQLKLEQEAQAAEEEQRRREAQAIEEARLREVKRVEEETKRRAVEEMARMERDVKLKNEAKSREERERAEMLMAEQRAAEEQKRAEVELLRKAEDERLREIREKERAKEEAARQKAEVEAQRMKMLEDQRLAAARKLKEEEESRRSKRAASQATNNSPLMPPAARNSRAISPAARHGFLKVRLCEDCGQEAGPDPYCDSCAGSVVEVEVEESAFRKFSTPMAQRMPPPSSNISKKKSDSDDEDFSEEEMVLRVCSDCGEEAGKERFCTVCGGDVIGLDGDDLDVMSPSGKLSMDAGKAMDTVQIYDNVAALERELGIGKKSIAVTLKQRDYDAVDRDVFILDLGTDSIKYGWSSDAVPGILPQTYKPVFDARRNDYFADNVEIADTIKALLEVGNYKSANPLLITSSLPTVCEGNEDLLDALMEPGRLCVKPPPHVFFATSPVLSAYEKNNCLPVALVVEIGHALLSIVPVYSGWSMSYAAVRVPFGAVDLLAYLAVLADVSLSKNFTSVKNALAQGCRLAQTFEKEMEEKGYSKGSGSPIEGFRAVTKETTRQISGISVTSAASLAVGELLFRPSLWASQHKLTDPVHELVVRVLAACPACPELASNIILAGECARLPGLASRLELELQAKGVTSAKVKVADSYSAWQGAKALASTANFKKHHCITPLQADVTWFKYCFNM